MPKEKTVEDKIRKALSEGRSGTVHDLLSKVSTSFKTGSLQEPEIPIPTIKTNTVMDDLLGGGGIESGKTVLLFGEYATGKTQTVFTLVAECPDEIYYIDAEGTFSRKRIKQICKARGINWEDLDKRLHVVEPMEWYEQMALLKKIPSPMDLAVENKKIGLIVIDSATALFRIEPDLQGREHLQVRQGFLMTHLKKDFKKICKMHQCVGVFTTQVYDKPVANAFLPDWCSQMPVGGHGVLHIPDFIVWLRKGEGNIRVARLVDSNETKLMERAFIINEKGIDNLPEEAKASEKMRKKEERYEKQQTQEKLKPKRKELEKEEK